MKQHKLQAEFDAITAAQTAAASTAKAMIDAFPTQWYPCGFAWVRIKPARGRLVEALKEKDIGHTSEEGGYVVHNPSQNSTQWMDAKEAGARAFINELALFLITQPASYTKYKIHLESRID